MELGADAVELDVHLTSDGALVCHHDATVAHPQSGHATAIRDLDAATVTALRYRGEPVPTLEAVLALLDGRLVAYCELKGPGTAGPTIEVLVRSGAPAAVHAFDHRQVAEANRRAPQVPRGVLEASYPLDPLSALRSVDARDLWRHWEHIDEALVQAVHAAGKRVIAWTANDPRVMERFADWGVDGLCTDDVALARRIVGSR